MRLKNVVHLFVAVIVLAAGNAVPASAQTNGFLLQCSSARSAGKACLNRGQEGVPTSLFRDPANIVQFERPAFELDVATIVPFVSFTNASNADVSGYTHAYPVPSVAYIGPRFMDRLAWGIGIEGIGGLGAHLKLDHPLLGTGLEYRSLFGAIKAGPVVAYELTDALSLGASVSYSYGMITDFRMPFALPPSAATGLSGLAALDPAHYPALFSSFTELDVYGDTKGFGGGGWGADFGVTYRADRFTVSASFSPKTTMALDGGDVVMDMTEQFNVLFGALVQERMVNHGEDAATAQATVAGLLTAAGIDLALEPVANYTGATEMSTPMTVGVGVRFEPADAWVLGVEAEFRQWSEAMASMPFNLSDGDNPNINLLVNGDPARGGFSYPFPMRWTDTWAVKLGVERWVGENAYRFGYHYGQNPVPESTVFAIFPAIATHAISAGATVNLGGIPLDVSGTYALPNTLTGASDSLVGSEYAGSENTLSGFGINLTVIKHF